LHYQKQNSNYMTKSSKKLKLERNANPLVFEVIARPTHTSDGKILNWGIGKIRYEDRNQIKHLNEFFPGINRDVNPSHIERLKESILKHGYIGGIMVGIIKGHMLCGDANNRWYALMGLKRDIPIIYAEFDTVEAFMEVAITTNNSGKNWGTGQYIGTYNVMERDGYKKLIEMKKTFQFSNTVLVALLGGLDIQSAKSALKNGTFELIEKRNKGYQLRVESAWGFANKFVTNLFAGDEPLKANNQRIGEAIIHLMGHIQSTSMFKDISIDLANECNELYKNERSTKQFTNLFIDGYRNLTEN